MEVWKLNEEKKIVEKAISELENKLDTTECSEELKFTPQDILLKRDIDYINKVKLENIDLHSYILWDSELYFFLNCSNEKFSP